MDVSKFRRMLPLVASVALVTSLTIGAYAAPAAAKPDEQQVAAKQARAEARAEAKAARDADKLARAEARAEAKADREAAKLARAEARAVRKAAKQANRQKVDVCHKPGTPAEGTLNIPQAAARAHLAHGDTEGACEAPELVPFTTCPELDPADTDDGDPACEEAEQLVVSIEAPETIESGASLTLQGAVSGLGGGDPTFTWSSTCLTDEELVDPSIIASEPGTALLVIHEGILTAEMTCEFTLMVADESEGVEGSATVAVEVVALS